MQNVRANISFTLHDQDGELLHRTSLEYPCLDADGMLFIEKHLIGFLATLNTEAAEIAAEKRKTGSVG